MATVYLETSFISYLTARPSRDIVIAGHQQTTQDWWESERYQFEIYISELVIQEACRGDKNAAQERLDILNQLYTLQVTPAALQLAESFLARAALPKKLRLMLFTLPFVLPITLITYSLGTVDILLTQKLAKTLKPFAVKTTMNHQ